MIIFAAPGWRAWAWRLQPLLSLSDEFQAYDRLADVLEVSLDMPRLDRIIEEGC